MMKKAFTRTVAFLVATVILSSLALTGISAADAYPKSMLALGDSITTGYGLENYTPGGDPYFCDSYGNLVAAALGLEGGTSYINKAVNGDTSGDLAALLPSLETYVKASELIVISIGGNDLLQVVPDIAAIIAGRELTGLEDAAGVLMSVTPDQFESLKTNNEFLAKISSVFLSFISNMASIGTYLEANAPNARVVFLKQYNPMMGVPGFAEFGDFAGVFIDPINATIDTMCKTHGFEYIDVPSVIDCNAAGLTNMMNYDIHPNAAGHLEIAKLLASHLGISLNSSEETTAPDVTTELTPDVTTEPYPEVTTEPESDTTPEPEVTTEPEPETTPEPVVTTEPEVTTEAEVTTEPVTEPVTEPITETIVTTDPVTETVTEPETDHTETTSNDEVTTESVTEPEVTTAPDVTESPSETTFPETSAEFNIEAPGCFSSVSCAILAVTSVCALVVLKKKNN